MLFFDGFNRRNGGRPHSDGFADEPNMASELPHALGINLTGPYTSTFVTVYAAKLRCIPKHRPFKPDHMHCGTTRTSLRTNRSTRSSPVRTISID